MRRGLAGLAVVFALGVGGTAFGGDGLVAVLPAGSVARVGGYVFDFGEADDAARPRAWQGPIRITGADGRRCTVSDAVGIVERPITLVRGRMLYVSTYSGSEDTLFVVDAGDCSVRWTSPVFVGVARVEAGAVVLPGGRRFAIRERPGPIWSPIRR